MSYEGEGGGVGGGGGVDDGKSRGKKGMALKNILSVPVPFSFFTLST